jgi:hypothetical protein
MRILICLLSISVIHAATYTVAPSGGDYTTIQACADAAQPGDTCLVTAGTYNERIVTTRGGSAANLRLTFLAQGTVTMKGFDIRHPYITVDGFDMADYYTDYSAYVAIGTTANYTEILNNTIREHNGVGHVAGVDFNYSGGVGAASCIIRGNSLMRLNYEYIILHGDGHLVENNTLTESRQWDLFLPFGTNHVIRRNVMGNPGTPLSGNHPDFVQAYSVGNEPVEDLLIEENFISELPSQMCQMNSSVNGVGALVSNMKNITFRRNVIMNVPDNCNVSVPFMTFENNTFYRLGYNGTGHAIGASLTRGVGNNMTFRNNVFLAGGTTPNTTNDTRGFYSVSDGRILAEAFAMLVTGETPFASCSITTCPIATGIATDLKNNGYLLNTYITAAARALTSADDMTLDAAYAAYKSAVYDVVAQTVALETLLKTTFSAHHNYVGGASSAGFPTKKSSGCNCGATSTPSNFCEASCSLGGINGGDPLLANISNPLGADGLPFTADDGFRPLADSPLCTGGESGTYIGAYDCGATPVVTWTVSGRLTVTGSGADVAITGTASAATTADGSGDFSISGLADGTYTVTPTKAGVTFSPASIDVTISGANQFATFGAAAGGTVRTVKTDGTGDYTTIQACVTAAQAGDTCWVYPGNYPEFVATPTTGTGLLTIAAVYKANSSATQEAERSTAKGFRIRRQNVTVDGFDITKYDVGLSMGHVSVEATGSNCKVVGNVIRDGIWLYSSSYYFDATTHTITNAAGGFIAAGFVPGVKIYVTSDFNAQHLNHDTIKDVTAVTDTVLTVTDTDTGVANWEMVTEGPVESTLYVTRSDKGGVTGVHFSMSGGVGPSGCTVANNRMSNLAGLGILTIAGSNTLIERNELIDMHGWRLITLSGSNNTFQYNVFRDSPRWEGFSPPDPEIPHAPGTGTWDMYAQFVYSTATSVIAVNDNLFEYNIIKDIDNSMAQVEWLGETPYGIGMTFRRNVFVGVEGHGALHYPQTHVLNNTFVNTAVESADAFIMDDSLHGAPEESTVKNNAFVGVGDIPEYGWYNVNPLYATPDYNFVAASGADGFAAKAGFAGDEAHGVNGGDPRFANISDVLGADGLPFTADDGLIPQAGSPLCGAGEGGVDIGAYSCAGSAAPQAHSHRHTGGRITGGRQ